MFVMQSNLKLSFGLVIVIVRQHQLRKRIRGFDLPKLKARETVMFATLSSRCCYIPVLALTFLLPCCDCSHRGSFKKLRTNTSKAIVSLALVSKVSCSMLFFWNEMIIAITAFWFGFWLLSFWLWSQGFRHWLAFFVFGLLWQLIFECVWCMKEAGEPCTLSWHTPCILKVFQYFWRGLHSSRASTMFISSCWNWVCICLHLFFFCNFFLLVIMNQCSYMLVIDPSHSTNFILNGHRMPLSLFSHCASR